MDYSIYFCSAKCDGKACFIIYPNVTPSPKKCVISPSDTEWLKIENVNGFSEFFKEVLHEVEMIEKSLLGVDEL